MSTDTAAEDQAEDAMRRQHGPWCRQIDEDHTEILLWLVDRLKARGKELGDFGPTTEALDFLFANPPDSGGEREARYHIYMDGELVTANAAVQDHPDPVGGSIVRRSFDAAPAPESGALEEQTFVCPKCGGRIAGDIGPFYCGPCGVDAVLESGALRDAARRAAREIADVFGPPYPAEREGHESVIAAMIERAALDPDPEDAHHPFGWYIRQHNGVGVFTFRCPPSRAGVQAVIPLYAGPSDINASEGEALEAEADPTYMLAQDNRALKLAGDRLAVAAIRVADEYDGVHRLRIAVSEWNRAVADEGGRAERYAAPAPDSGALEALRMLDRRFRLVRVVSQSKDPDRAVCDYEATLTLTERIRIERLAARKEG